MRRPTTDRLRIIELFAKRQPAYTRADVLRLLGISDQQLSDAITEGAVSVEQDDVGAEVIAWEDVAHLGLQEWTPRMIAAALGESAAEIIPPLNQHRQIRVSLPVYLIRFVEHLARIESAPHRVARNASDIIEYVLHGRANGNDADINTAIPGFGPALQYPYFTPRDGASQRCRYCGIVVTTSHLDACRVCTERHESEGKHP